MQHAYKDIEQRIKLVFPDEPYDYPSDYRSSWIDPRTPLDSNEEMDEYLFLNRSVFDVSFPQYGLWWVPLWAEKRVAESMCHILCDSPNIKLSVSDKLHIVVDFFKGFDVSDPNWLPYRSLSENQWELLSFLLVTGLGPEGLIYKWCNEDTEHTYCLKSSVTDLLRFSVSRILASREIDEDSIILWRDCQVICARSSVPVYVDQIIRITEL